MSSHTHERIERGPLAALAFLVLLSVIVIFLGQFTGRGQQERAEIELIDPRSVIFDDASEGQVTVTDAETGALITTFDSGEGGFARTALRAMAYSRQVNAVEKHEPFLLAKASDARLVLHDPSTDKTITLSAFGEANAQEFAPLLEAGGTAP